MFECKKLYICALVCVLIKWTLKNYDGGRGGVACIELLWLKIVISGLLLQTC